MRTDGRSDNDSVYIRVQHLVEALGGLHAWILSDNLCQARRVEIGGPAHLGLRHLEEVAQQFRPPVAEPDDSYLELAPKTPTVHVSPRCALRFISDGQDRSAAAFQTAAVRRHGARIPPELSSQGWKGLGPVMLGGRTRDPRRSFLRRWYYYVRKLARDP